ncbi:fumarylacetoacetate hydrolase family protein [Aspergillus bombycis]|uniref:Fumarylacetoacetate hydrolase family protein n=1 Tax=Aspergillus bombycis TaxID=109264 RepID=A0A1F7ZMR2_9EURO|nr:fumarylacetoacetate hydrolase family protein [Aspergillus bombycis]OGM40721.1 fumarylacetoacetate hydrolase family protein [Aspergillus bombycis]
MSWSRLIRFVDTTGKVCFGEPAINDVTKLVDECLAGTLYAQEFVGDSALSVTPGARRLQVKEILGVLRPEDIPIIRCVGLNYMAHIKEGGRTPPPHPSLFIKPNTSIAAYNEDIPIPQIAQDSVDYEGELSVVIGKTGRNIPMETALDYVAGYVVANDVSCRSWQKDPRKAGGVPQWCFSKGFDKFAPLGPVLVSPKVVGAADNLRLQTLVNGEVRQDTNTSDLLFNVPHLISFLSQGTTLEKGTIIMTGTPSGVAMGMTPPKYLKAGDIVEVSIEGLGSTKNIMAFE